MSRADQQEPRHAAPEQARSATPPRISLAAAAGACRDLLGIEPSRIEYPGGTARSSVRAVAGSDSWIVTRRRQAARSALEAGVLRELRAAGAPVPKVLAFDGEWLIQQDFGDRRLTSVLRGPSLLDVGDWVARAAGALLLCQRAAGKLGLSRRVAPIGVAPAWLEKLLSTPAQIAASLGIDDPRIEEAIGAEQLLPRRHAFVKWDARPGNALLVGDHGLAWIDWEHCGTRDALDDLAWLLCDEYMPDDARLEAALLKRFLPLFAFVSGRAAEDALHYLYRLGSLHSCVRLELVLERKGGGDWWDAAACERADRVGVTAAGAQRLCARGARWASRFPRGQRLSRFFSEAGQRLRAMPAASSTRPAAAAPAARDTFSDPGAPRPTAHT